MNNLSMKKKIHLCLFISLFTIPAFAQIPAGYYDAATGLNCQALKTVLKTITNTGTGQLSYTPGLWNAYGVTDIKPGSTNLIWDIYTDDNDPNTPETFNFIYSVNQCGNYNSEGDCYNREHTTPASWFNDAAPMYTDIHHILPTDGWVNNKRSNWPYGNVTNATYTSIDNQSKLGTGNNFGYTGTVFEPFAAFKGDVARIALYMATRHEDRIIDNNWAGGTDANRAMLQAGEEGLDAAGRRLQIYDAWYLKTLFAWMAQDPVSQKEIDRNNAIYYNTIQHNRNPFVDHPEYAAMIWQCTGLIPVTIVNFTAAKNNDKVNLIWQATQEVNFRNYIVQRSTNGIDFNDLETVNGDNRYNYDFTDFNLPHTAMVYYRLKVVDMDGKFSYTKIIPIKLDNKIGQALIYPNPNYGQYLQVRLSESLAANSQIVITDVTGKSVLKTTAPQGNVNVTLNVKALAAGRYFIKIYNELQLINESFVLIRP